MYCVKCSGYSVSGPTYVQDRDRLRYTCRQCGYFWHRKPDDAKDETAASLGDLIASQERE
jgi:hypothetical protein